MPDFSDLISDYDIVHITNVICHPGIQTKANWRKHLSPWC